MSWMDQLLKTYDYNVKQGPDVVKGPAPVAHMTVNTQVEIDLNSEGAFLAARVLEKGPGAVTLIPVTEDSAGRSSGIAPHALSDMLPYIAGDFETYCKDFVQINKTKCREKYACYIESLRAWAESEHATPKVLIVYKYLAQKTLIGDLAKAGIVELTEQGHFTNQKISGQPMDKVMVRFLVYDDVSGTAKTWEDSSLIGAYQKYYMSKLPGRSDICYLTGLQATTSEKHPKGIIAASYGAKLVSANDKQGFTYRGRFQTSEQPLAIGYEASQKVHSALTWLAKTQGVYIGSRMYICWNPDGKALPSLFSEKEPDETETVDSCSKEEASANYRRKLIKTFQGYQDQFEPTDPVIIMALEAATTGRLSITYYSELFARDFFRRIIHWGDTCNWSYLKFSEASEGEKKKAFFRVETPTFRRIVTCAYGRETSSCLEMDDKIMKQQIQRLVKCMIDQQRIPYDIVRSITLRASTPLAYSVYNRERVLSTACAVILKYYYDHDKEKKETYRTMKLDSTNKDRSYLFGRLLAIYEKIERVTYDRTEKREPNAIRFQTAFANHPLQVWRLLDEKTKPYLRKLSPSTQGYYRKLITEITTSFSDVDEKKLNQTLKETYLLGYYLQRAELNRKKGIETDNMTEE